MCAICSLGRVGGHCFSSFLYSVLFFTALRLIMAIRCDQRWQLMAEEKKKKKKEDQWGEEDIGQPSQSEEKTERRQQELPIVVVVIYSPGSCIKDKENC